MVNANAQRILQLEGSSLVSNCADQHASERAEHNQVEGGTATVDITPQNSQFLFGYPYVRRYSTGVHDPLLSSALYLSDGRTRIMIISNDVIYVSKASVARIRERVSALTSVPDRNIMISATHTHSGPLTLNLLTSEDDAVVPKADAEYIRFMEDKVVSAATEAARHARPVEVGLTTANGAGVGTNRRDPAGPVDPEVPVLMVRSLPDRANVACLVVYSMHPTVLHEDSTLISADFPGVTRAYLQREVVGRSCAVLYHTGPAGNQSPRHSVTSNTFPEAERLGLRLAKAIAKVIPQIHYVASASISCCQESVELPVRSFPSVERAQVALKEATARLERLRSIPASSQQIRTAEVDLFGAREALMLAREGTNPRLKSVIESCLPAEIQTVQIGSWTFVAWQGEIFVEYGLVVKAQMKNTYVISLANGELQGYITTEAAVAEGAYEAANALFAPASGTVLVTKTLEMLAAGRRRGV